MPDYDDPSNIVDTFRQNVNARASQMMYDSGIAKAGRAVSNAADSAYRTVSDAYNSAKERFFPSKPEYAGRDIQLPKDKYSRKNFNPQTERRNERRR